MDRLVFVLLLLFSIGSAVFSQSRIECGTSLSATRPAVWQQDTPTNNGVLLRWDNGLVLLGSTREEKIQSFLTSFGPEIGLKSTPSFSFISEQQDLAGFYHLKMAQLYQGIPVFDGHLSFHFDKKNRLQTISGILLEEEDIELTAVLTPEDAAAVALSWLDEKHPGSRAIVVKNALNVYQEGMVKGDKGDIKLSYYLELSNQKDVRDYLIIDAKTGQVIEHIPGICHLLQREVYLSSLNNIIWQEGDVYPSSLDTWQQNEVIHSESIYNLFRNTFQFTSYDNQDGVMRIIDQAEFMNCPNASWNGYSTNYCNGLGVDDVIGHEWGHAYTEYTSNLLLIWQSGAINEAYSDIWGETLDILNGDGDVNVLRTDCDNSSRWKIAEASGVLSEPIRDMYTPNCYDHPGKLSDEQYHCDSSDHGGVHSNAGIASHAYALLVDGGEYNGYDIPGIGLTKAAHIFWQAQRMYLSRTSGFKILANGLEAACNDLRGVNLPALSLAAEDASLSGELIDANDSLTLSMVIAATEMRMDIDVCPEYEPALNPNAEDWCTEISKVFYPFYFEDFEGDVSSWSTSELPGDETSWVPRQWQLTEQLPANKTGKGMFGPSPNVGHCDAQVNNGIIQLESPPIVIPNNLEGHVYLTFDHYFSLEKGEDGGNIKIQQNGGGWTKIPPSAFLFNAYNDILPLANFTENPMAAEGVFSGANEGAVLGSWGTTQIDLDIIGVREGDEIVMRWDVGTNGCDGWDGWYIDNIKLGTCSSAPLLPVEWLSFTAHHVSQGVRLDWATAREENNAGFTIERSKDGRNFENLAWVEGRGDRETRTDYEFFDTQLTLKSDYLYYRLRQEDYNGSYTYSLIRELKIDYTVNWDITPNPVSDQIRIDWQGIWPNHTNLQIYNLQGQLVYSLPEWDPSFNTVNVSHLPAGVYLLQLTGNNYIRTQRFAKG